MKKLFLFLSILALVALPITQGCSIPSRQEIQDAKDSRDGSASAAGEETS